MKKAKRILVGTTAKHVAHHAPCHVLLSLPPQK